jgi:hypothetical protein
LRQASCVQSGDHPVTSLGESIKTVMPNSSAPPIKSSARPTFFHIPACSFRNNGTLDCFDKKVSGRFIRMFLNSDHKPGKFLLLFKLFLKFILDVEGCCQGKIHQVLILRRMILHLENRI